VRTGTGVSGDNEIPSITLQLAPSAHVSEDMRRVVLESVDEAGLAFAGWVPLQGEADLAKWPRVAQPSLTLILSWSDAQDAERFPSELGIKVGNALARIRALLPALPVGINVVVDRTVRWFSFRPSDSAEAMRRGASALESVFAGDSGAYGWDDEARHWISL
jgi:hypothetical protein